MGRQSRSRAARRTAAAAAGPIGPRYIVIDPVSRQGLLSFNGRLAVFENPADARTAIGRYLPAHRAAEVATIPPDRWPRFRKKIAHHVISYGAVPEPIPPAAASPA